jgi:ABC-2 type transport system ATP-binding protein
LAEEAIVVENLVKIYPRVKAVDDVSFNITAGEIFGLLGPNGAGKTTTIRILLTLIKPTSGKIRVFGINGLAHPENLRQMSGYIPQEVSADGEITGYENLLIYAKLYGIPSKERNQRIKEVLEYLDLQDRANSMVNTYSGGMMRRLELAQALVNRPRVLFLDEPSIGLDPGARSLLWELVKRLRSEFKTTILITTHDMVEADALCDRIAIMSRGKMAVIGEPSYLKSTVGGDVLTLSSKAPNLSALVKELGYSTMSEPSNGTVDIITANGEAVIPNLVEAFKDKGAEVDSVSLKKPTLDDVFLKYTGTRIDEGDSWSQTRKMRTTFRKLAK